VSDHTNKRRELESAHDPSDNTLVGKRERRQPNKQRSNFRAARRNCYRPDFIEWNLPQLRKHCWRSSRRGESCRPQYQDYGQHGRRATRFDKGKRSSHATIKHPSPIVASRAPPGFFDQALSRRRLRRSRQLTPIYMKVWIEEYRESFKENVGRLGRSSETARRGEIMPTFSSHPISSGERKHTFRLSHFSQRSPDFRVHGCSGDCLRRSERC